MLSGLHRGEDEGIEAQMVRPRKEEKRGRPSAEVRDDHPLGGKRGRGRPKKSLEEVVREDLRVVGLSEDMAQDRRLWRDRIKVSECRGPAA